MSQNTLSQPPRKDDGRFDDWIYRLWKRVAGSAQILWSQIDKTGAEFVGDSGSGGAKGVVPAPATGDAAKYLKGNGTWASVIDVGTASISTTSTHIFDGSDHVREITLTNAITVTFGAPSGITQYAMYKFILKAGDANTRTFAWNAAYKFPSAVAQLTAGTVTSGASDIITFIGGASNTLLFDGVSMDVR